MHHYLDGTQLALRTACSPILRPLFTRARAPRRRSNVQLQAPAASNKNLLGERVRAAISQQRRIRLRLPLADMASLGGKTKMDEQHVRMTCGSADALTTTGA